jgi:hypothetical protein
MSLKCWSSGGCKLDQPLLQAMRSCELKNLAKQNVKAWCHLQERLKEHVS